MYNVYLYIYEKTSDLECNMRQSSIYVVSKWVLERKDK